MTADLGAVLAAAAVFTACAVCLLPDRRSSPAPADPAAGLAEMVAAAAAQVGGTGNVVAVELTDTELRLFRLSGAANRGRGRRSRWWTVDRPEDLAAGRAVVVGHGLTLLPVGRSAAGVVLVNLDAVGTMSVTGPEASVVPLVTHYRELLAADRDEVEVVGWDEQPDQVEPARRTIVGCPSPPVGGWPVRVAGSRLELPVLDLIIDSPVSDPPPPVVVGEAEPVPAVRLLGPLELGDDLDGLAGRGRQLIAYLASHRDGVTEERLRTVLWDRPPTRGTFNNLISSTRSALGALDGEAVLPRLGPDRRYRLAPTVGTDLERFEQLAADGCGAEALGLVRGEVFDEGRLDWASLEGLATWWERRIVDVAHQLARSALADGNLDLAMWAIDQGLRAAPGDEQLFRDRMLAWDQAGNPAAVESAMAELCGHVGGGDPVDLLHPETVAMYRRCGRGHHLPVSG